MLIFVLKFIYIIIIPIAIMVITMKTNDFIKHLRLEMNLSQIEICNLLSIKQSTFSNYETGKRKPSISICYKLIKLAKIKGITVTLENIIPDE